MNLSAPMESIELTEESRKVLEWLRIEIERIQEKHRLENLKKVQEASESAPIHATTECVKTFVAKSPSDVARMRTQIEQDIDDRHEQFAQVAVDVILRTAALHGFNKVYLYNESMDSDSSCWPAFVVRRAVEILNESGHWRASAVRRRFWHALLFINNNWIRHSGSPVWRIFLTPLSGSAEKDKFDEN